MKLPNRHQATIPVAKLTNYLVSEDHPVGGHKAVVFRTVGFTAENVALLHQALMSLAQSEEVTETLPCGHGTKYVIDAEISTSQSTRMALRAIWIIEHGEENPRLVTAYPL